MYFHQREQRRDAVGVNFDVKTDPNIDQVSLNCGRSKLKAQLPADVRNYGITLLEISDQSDDAWSAFTLLTETHDGTFLANYAYINVVDQLTQLKGISNVQVFGAGQYAMRFWVKPDQTRETKYHSQRTSSKRSTRKTPSIPRARSAAHPRPKGQEFTYAITAQGRLVSEKEFGEVVIRENPDGRSFD